jgi:pimeloyl-ACP methyl ester carboxylesterase
MCFTRFLLISISSLVSIFGLTAFGAASGDLSREPQHIRGQSGRAQRSQLTAFTSTPANLTPGIFSQIIDHTGSLPGQTFKQRYWVDSEFAKTPDAPVLIRICGEGEASEFFDDATPTFAQALGARIIYLEHRYYGLSQPFSDQSSDHLKYLNLNNVIEDIATFQKSISTQNGWTGKWISLGGSYSGTVSAIYRLKHPELVVGALAASAPMISGIGSRVGMDSDVDSLSDINSPNDGSRAWVYQACTNFGIWEAEGAEPGAAFDLPSEWLCSQLFGVNTLPSDTAFNQQYDQPFIAANGTVNQIMFSYGTDDVWTGLGISTQNPQNAGVTIQMIEGGGHHFDLNAPSSNDTAAVLQARSNFLQLAQNWLN